jgi:hypothetical protein
MVSLVGHMLVSERDSNTHKTRVHTNRTNANRTNANRTNANRNESEHKQTEGATATEALLDDLLASLSAVGSDSGKATERKSTEKEAKVVSGKRGESPLAVVFPPHVRTALPAPLNAPMSRDDTLSLLVTDFACILDKREHADVLFRTCDNNAEVYGVKALIAARSHTFARMFDGYFQEAYGWLLSLLCVVLVLLLLCFL